MQHVIIGVIAFIGVVLWASSVYCVNEEIEKLQLLAKDRTRTAFSVNLKAPSWKILTELSERRVWIAVALILAPLLVVLWGASLIAFLIFVLIPELIRESYEDVLQTMKKSYR